MRLPGITFVCNEYPPAPHGGIGTFTQVIGRALTARGFHVRVAGIYPGTPSGWSREMDCGVEVFRHGRIKGRDPLRMRTRYTLFQQIRQWAADGATDVVEVPDFEGWAYGWPPLSVPVVARTHGSATYFRNELRKPKTLQSRIAAHLERGSMRRADSWCSVSEYTASQTQRMFGLEAADAITYNPVSIPQNSGDGIRSRTKVVFTGTLTPKKGILPLARAWGVVAGCRPDAELHVFGKDTSGMERLMRRECGDAGNATMVFHGHSPRPRVLDELATARLAVFPSYAEAFAFAPLEAMAAGCPTIYSTRTSGPEAVRHGVDGLLVDPDRPEDIAAAVLEVLNDDAVAFRLGRAGREKIQTRFSMEVVLPAIESFYLEAIERFRERRAPVAVASGAQPVV